MSRQLLEYLNQRKRHHFSKWLEEHPGEPRIAWYPGAGLDFAPLFYFSNIFRTQNQKYDLPDPPQIFLFTESRIDYLDELTQGVDRNLRRTPWVGGNALEGLRSFMNTPFCPISTTGFISNGKRIIPEFYSPSDGFENLGPIHFPQAEIELEHVYFSKIRIHIDGEKPFIQPLLYVFLDTSYFASKVLMSQNARISHLYCMNREVSSSPWLGYLLRRLRAEVVLTDDDELFYRTRSLNQLQQAFELEPALEGTVGDVPNPTQWTNIEGGWYTKTPQQP